MQGMQPNGAVTANRNCSKTYDITDCLTYFYRAVRSCIRVIICIIVFISLFSSYCFAAQTGDQYSELYSELEVGELEQLTKDEIGQYYDGNIEIEDPKSFWNMNGFDFVASIIKNTVSVDGSSLNVLSVFLVITILYALTVSFSETANKVNVSYETTSLAVSALILLTPVSVLIFDVCNAVRSCSVFMNAFIPVYAALFYAMGKTASSASYSTLMFSVSQLFVFLADKVLAPLSGIMLTASVGSSFGSVSKRYYELLKKLLTVVLSSSMGIFITVLNLQTAISAPADTVGIKTVKTALGSLVPIVGSALSDSVSVLVAGAGTLKSSVGAYAVISIAVLVLPTLIKLIIWRVTVGICGGLLELSGSKATIELIKSFGSVITLMISVLLCVAVAYLLSVILTLSAGV